MHGVRLPQLQNQRPPAPSQSESAAAFERELKAQLDPQRLTASQLLRPELTLSSFC